MLQERLPPWDLQTLVFIFYFLDEASESVW